MIGLTNQNLLFYKERIKGHDMQCQVLKLFYLKAIQSSFDNNLLSKKQRNINVIIQEY